MKKPMTTQELFNKIIDILKEKGKLPDILDYHLADDYNPIPITDCDFSFGNELDYGCNEGIYLDIYFYWRGEKNRIGIFKTLKHNSAAIHTMAALLADFLIEGYQYVNNNLDDFTWERADVYPVKEDGEPYGFRYSCSTMEQALKRKDEFLKKYKTVIIRDNATRKETVFNNKE